MSWRVYNSVELEREYSPASRVENIQTFLDHYAQAGEHSRQCIRHDKLKFGQHDDEWLWLAKQSKLIDDAINVNEKRRQKLVVFVHGGFWHRLSADDGTFMTGAWHQLGYDYASINYSLCPNDSLDVIVNQILKATKYLRTIYNADNITLIGHSAGAHLIAMVLTSSKTPKFRQAILVSGIFDLLPLVETSINQAIQLDAESAHRLSPIHLVARAPDTPMTIIWGENETDEFKRQSRDFASAWAKNESHTPVITHEIAGRNHYDILYDLPNEVK